MRNQATAMNCIKKMSIVSITAVYSDIVPMIWESLTPTCDQVALKRCLYPVSCGMHAESLMILDGFDM